ncbi:unnamed protein product [Tenebrio molitor]|nr:unnamed protein product [Tenebrio molitor]
MKYFVLLLKKMCKQCSVKVNGCLTFIVISIVGANRKLPNRVAKYIFNKSDTRSV